MPPHRVSKNPRVDKGPQPLKLYSGSDDMCVRTDENPKVFVLCYFCRPGANARGETRKNSKKWRIATFLTDWGAAFAAPFWCPSVDKTKSGVPRIKLQHTAM